MEEKITQESKELKKVSNIKDVLKETLTMDQITMPVLSRLKKRMKQLKELSRAETIKQPIGMGVMHIHKTVPPKIFISGLDSRFNGQSAAIVYMTYKTQKHPKTGKLMKVIKKQTMKLPDIGDFNINGNYILDKVYIETIEYGKSIKRQLINPEDVI